jgi:hypothetical protein
MGQAGAGSLFGNPNYRILMLALLLENLGAD